MLIGKDFDKIEWNFFGWHLLEPNAFIGDVIILSIALYLAYKIHKIPLKTPFFNYWKWFFIIFGIGFFVGGIGHLMYNYLGLPGKYFSWYSGIVASFLVEKAMISIYPNTSWRTILTKISLTKMIIALVVATIVYTTVDLTTDQSKALLVTTINAIVGLGLTLGVLGFYYTKRINSCFRYLWLSTLILIPSAFLQSLKINFHQWFDRNDASHVLLITSLILYYICIKNFAKSITSEKVI
jgi:hypothetical protein